MLDLTGKNMKELRDIAKQIGLPGIKAESMESLRARIVLTLEPGVIDALTPPDLNPIQQKKKEPQVTNLLTAQQVLDALEPFKGKIKIAFYDDEGNMTTDGARSWCVRNGVAEDSGSMSVPLKWIRFKAQEIANARFPAVIRDEFDAVRNIPVLA